VGDGSCERGGNVVDMDAVENLSRFDEASGTALPDGVEGAAAGPVNSGKTE
jgi:hypothetical protein